MPGTAASDADPHEQGRALAGGDADAHRQQRGTDGRDRRDDAHPPGREAAVEEGGADAAADARRARPTRGPRAVGEPSVSEGEADRAERSADGRPTKATGHTDVRREATPPTKSESP